MGNALLNPINHRQQGEAGARGGFSGLRVGSWTGSSSSGSCPLSQFPGMDFFLENNRFSLKKHSFPLKLQFSLENLQFFFLEKSHVHSQIQSCSTRRDQQLELGGLAGFGVTPSPWSNSKQDLSLQKPQWQQELEGSCLMC